MIHKHFWYCLILNKLGFKSTYRVSSGKRYTTWVCERCSRQHRERYFPTVPLVAEYDRLSQGLTFDERRQLRGDEK